MVKNLPVMQETWVPSLGQADPLEKGMATHSSILAWRIPRTEEPGGLQSSGSHRVGHDLVYMQCEREEAKGSQDPAHCLWNYRLLNRSGGLP